MKTVRAVKGTTTMRALASVTLLGLAASLLPAPMATAGPWPSEFYSSIPAPMTACPAGDMVYSITMHDWANRPLTYTMVVLEFDRCPPFRLAPAPGDEGYWLDFSAVADTTDGAARVDFAIRGGGTCPAGGVRIRANGVGVATRALASPDQDGDLVVSAADRALASTKLGSADPTADFDRDGAVTAADLDALSAHLGHHAPGVTTPVRPTTWGTIKLLYR